MRYKITDASFHYRGWRYVFRTTWPYFMAPRKEPMYHKEKDSKVMKITAEQFWELYNKTHDDKVEFTKN